MRNVVASTAPLRYDGDVLGVIHPQQQGKEMTLWQHTPENYRLPQLS
jgi:hypothetical protein